MTMVVQRLYHTAALIAALGAIASSSELAMASCAPETVILQLHLNIGGDYKEGVQYLIDPLARLWSINRKWHLFVLADASALSAGHDTMF
jgi:hypothetical protein